MNFKPNSNINRKINALMLIMLLVYPMVFSFLHVKTHHLNSHLHVVDDCCHPVQVFVNPDTVYRFEASLEHCPIAEFEFPFAITVNSVIAPGIISHFTDWQYVFLSNFSSSEKKNLNAPRAPPFLI
ncbi:MAG: hypothetical protein JXR50_10780 [Prolixibacteraceae bacterium]|nr:hypothetical protein [Prolixibacteraceae bacterium]MBN2650211.1 hypothetical protein [Prolixibacteraceae bacterium]